MDYSALLQCAVKAVLKAGKEILEVYQKEFKIEHKADNSPLTEADKRAHKVIVEILEKTKIPILSEEGKNIPYEERKNWKKLWIVDPLDGTKEFIKRNGEFTVNIALVENHFPTLGVIYLPVKKTLYIAKIETGAFKIENCSAEDSWENILKKAEKLPIENKNETYKVVASRSHLSKETENYINELKKEHENVETVSMGSSLKICLIAEGLADEYPRFAPTMEWDTAAGQAIAEAAGATFINYKTKKRFDYNRPALLNDWFLVKR